MRERMFALCGWRYDGFFWLRLHCIFLTSLAQFCIHRNTIAFQKRLACNITTFQYLCSYAVAGNSHFVLLGVCWPGSRVLSVSFFDELSTVFKQFATYRCPVVVCSDFNVHVDQMDNVHTVQLTQPLQTFDCIQRVAAFCKTCQLDPAPTWLVMDICRL